MNSKKHGIDFETARRLWDDDQRVLIQAPHPIENRHILIAKSNNKHWTAIYTYRKSIIRIISVRQSRKKKKDLYEKK